jgi:hypothetical protein
MTLFMQLILQLHVHVLFRNYKMDENSRPRKQARLDTFLIPREYFTTGHELTIHEKVIY